MTDHVRIPIEGMTCGSCVSRITRAVRRVDGVQTVRVDLGDEMAEVAFQPDAVSLEAVAAAITGAGYVPRPDAAVSFEPRPAGGLLARLGLRR